MLAEISGLLAGIRFAVLTGAGLSTDSGIPDYRGPGAAPRTPMTYQEFIREPWKPATVLGPEPSRLVAPAPGGSQWRPYRSGSAGEPGPAHRPHHPERGPAPRGRRQPSMLWTCTAGSTRWSAWTATGRYSRRMLAADAGGTQPRDSWSAPLAAGLVEMAPDADATVEDSGTDRQLRRRALPGLRRDPEAGLRVLRRERAQGPGGTLLCHGRSGGGAAGGRLVPDRA